jgi:hypothetical protein
MGRPDGTVGFVMRIKLGNAPRTPLSVEAEQRTPLKDGMKSINSAITADGLSEGFLKVARDLRMLTSEQEGYKKVLDQIGEDAAARIEVAKAFVSTASYKRYVDLRGTKEELSKERAAQVEALNSGVGSFIGVSYKRLKKMRNELGHATGPEASAQRIFLDELLAKPFESAKLVVEERSVASSVFSWVACEGESCKYVPMGKEIVGVITMEEAQCRGGTQGVAEWIIAKANAIVEADADIEVLSREMSKVGLSLVESPKGPIEFREMLKLIDLDRERAKQDAESIAAVNEKAASNKKLIEAKREELESLKMSLDASVRKALEQLTGILSVDHVIVYPFLGDEAKETLKDTAIRWFKLSSSSYCSTAFPPELAVNSEFVKNAEKANRTLLPDLVLKVQVDQSGKTGTSGYTHSYGDTALYSHNSKLDNLFNGMQAGVIKSPYFYVHGDIITVIGERIIPQIDMTSAR